MSPESSAADRAHAALRAGILGGEHLPGSMLSENDLATRLGMSRTPVRAALLRLQDEGWITIYPKRGALVRTLDTREMLDLADARLMLECAGVRRADTGSRRSLAARLAPLIAAQRAALERDDMPSFIDLTIDFHRAFLEVGGNTVLIDVADRLGDRQRFLLLQRCDRLRARGEAILDEHAELVERLAADDPEGFAALLHAHISATLDADLPVG